MELQRIVYGYTTLPESWVFSGGSKDTAVPIDLAFFLLRLPGHTVLVDCGCDDMKGFLLRDFIGPVEALRREGLAPEDITDILITHAHGDHMAGVRHFPKAHVYIQQEELTRGQKYLLPTHTVTTFGKELTPFPGIRMVCIGGHSIGSAVVELENKTVLCGDECYTRYNLRHLVPTASSCNPENSKHFIDTYGHGWITHLCHEP
jgi:glyoxylase-like metal-dependent hydrolase (beta-lactamase superfamily II)